jgi:integrase
VAVPVSGVRSLAPSTRRAYAYDWAHFADWCAARRRRALPATAASVAAYVDDIASTRRPATVRRRLAGIAARHRADGLASPTGAAVVRHAMARAAWHGRRARVPTLPLTPAAASAMVAALAPTLAGARDAALLLVGYGAALRCSELVGLDVADVRLIGTVGPDAVAPDVRLIGADGSDDSGAAALEVRTARGVVLVPRGSRPTLCAVTAWARWLDRRGRAAGPAFHPIDRHGRLDPRRLSDDAVTDIVRRAARCAGLASPERWTGRSLRLGMMVTAGAQGTSETRIMRQTGLRDRRFVHEALEQAPRPT